MPTTCQALKKEDFQGVCFLGHLTEQSIKLIYSQAVDGGCMRGTVYQLGGRWFQRFFLILAPILGDDDDDDDPI